MYNKLFALLPVCAIVALLVSACATTAPPAQPPAATQAPAATQPPAATQAPAATTAASGQPVEISWWQLTGNDLQVKAWNEIIASFEAANPGVKVKMENRAVDAHKEALRVAMGTEAFPDIYFMWAGLGLGGEFVNAGASAPLDDVYTSMGWEERFVPPALAAAKQYGPYHGVPEVTHGQGLYYRKDAFEKAGITAPPTTYDELIAVNDKLIAAGYSPIQFGGTVNWHLMRLLDNILETKCGAETHDQLKQLKASWATTPCATEAFTELKRWSDDFIIPDFIGLDNNESTQLMYAGKAAMALEGDWMVGVFKADGQKTADYGLFVFPTGTGRLYAFNQMDYVGANSQHKPEAEKFLDYLSSPEVQAKYLGTFGSTSVTQGLTPPADQEPLDAQWVEILSSAKGVFENADQAFPLDVTTEYWRIMNLVATGGLDPTQAGAEFQKFLDNR